jgi:hypothetical protein
MTHDEAIAASHAMDSGRERCHFCWRPKATQADCDIFDNKEDGPQGGERPDLCWDIVFDDHCKSFQELHSTIETLLAIGCHAWDIEASVSRLLRPNDKISGHAPKENT